MLACSRQCCCSRQPFLCICALSCRPISFPPISCVVATWVCVVAVMASPANHLGVRVTSASTVLGSTWVGAVLAACVVSAGGSHTVTVCARADSPGLWGLDCCWLHMHLVSKIFALAWAGAFDRAQHSMCP